MTVYITKQEVEEMRNKVIDEATGMTELDLFEWRHSNEDWRVS